MTDRGTCSHAEFAGRRIVVDLSDADVARLTAIEARRGVGGAELVLAWIRRGLTDGGRGGLTDGARGGPRDRRGRTARDVAIAEHAEELFGDLVGDHDHSD